MGVESTTKSVLPEAVAETVPLVGGREKGIAPGGRPGVFLRFDGGTVLFAGNVASAASLLFHYEELRPDGRLTLSDIAAAQIFFFFRDKLTSDQYPIVIEAARATWERRKRKI